VAGSGTRLLVYQQQAGSHCQRIGNGQPPGPGTSAKPSTNAGQCRKQNHQHPWTARAGLAGAASRWLSGSLSSSAAATPGDSRRRPGPPPAKIPSAPVRDQAGLTSCRDQLSRHAARPTPVGPGHMRRAVRADVWQPTTITTTREGEWASLAGSPHLISRGNNRIAPPSRPAAEADSGSASDSTAGR